MAQFSIIQCAEDCIYQKDGYCSLEIPSAITNYTGNGCVHCIRVIPKREYEQKGLGTITPTEPQTPLLPFSRQ